MNETRRRVVVIPPCPAKKARTLTTRSMRTTTPITGPMRTLRESVAALRPCSPQNALKKRLRAVARQPRSPSPSPTTAATGVDAEVCGEEEEEEVLRQLSGDLAATPDVVGSTEVPWAEGTGHDSWLIL